VLGELAGAAFQDGADLAGGEAGADQDAELPPQRVARTLSGTNRAASAASFFTRASWAAAAEVLELPKLNNISGTLPRILI